MSRVPFVGTDLTSFSKSALVLAYIANDLLTKTYDYLIKLEELGHVVRDLDFEGHL